MTTILAGAATGRGLDWSLLGGDPTPGEPAGCAQAAARLALLAGETAQTASTTTTLGLDVGGGGWRGLASEAFLAAYTALPGDVVAIGEAASGAGRALSRWADALARLQSRAEQLLAEAEETDHRLRGTVAQIPGAVAAVQSAAHSLSAVSSDPDAEPAAVAAAARGLDRAHSALAALQRLREDLEETLERLRADARALAEEHADAAGGVARSVRSASPPPSGRPPFAALATGGGLLDGTIGITLDADGDGRVDPVELAAAIGHVLGDHAITTEQRVAALVLLGHLLGEAAATPASAAAVIEALQAQGIDHHVMAAFTVGNPVTGQQFIGPLSPVQVALRDNLVGPLLAVFATADDVDSWRYATYLIAGIDGAAWDPALGLAPLDGTAVAVWEFYQGLFAANPEQFLWSGMATLAGGTFYAAFQDIHVLRVGLERGAIPVEEAVEVLHSGFGVGVSWLAGELADMSAEALAAELRYVETTFLQMQKEIFDDLAWQHVAYAVGGLPSLESLHAEAAITNAHLDGWTAIDSGVPALVAQGNAGLLEHEQMSIIADDYDAMRDHSPVTWALTMGMSVIGHSPVPGGQPFRDVVPYEVGAHLNTPDRVTVYPDEVFGIDIPGPSVSVNTPDQVGASVDLPLHNVSIADHRWTWITEDMLPAWLGHVDGGTAESIVAVPITAQADDQRVVPDVGPFRYDPDR